MWYANVYRGFFSEGGNYSVQNHTQTRGCRSMLPREYFASRYLRLLLRLHTKYYIHIIIIVNNDSTQLFELDVWSGCTIIRLKRRVQIHLPVYGSVLMYDVHCFHTYLSLSLAAYSHWKTSAALDILQCITSMFQNGMVHFMRLAAVITCTFCMLAPNSNFA